MKKLKLGIVGAENSHTAAIASMINVHKKIPGFEVSHVWGETKQFAEAAAEQGQIPKIVRSPKDMIGKIISEEDPARPLSDKTVADMLAKLNMKVARRTVAKYRDELRIPPQNQRRRTD